MWTNKKYGKQQFKGSYSRKSGERIFELTSTTGKRVISFESYQMAKAVGWKKAK